jgi:hypothetical protein
MAVISTHLPAVSLLLLIEHSLLFGLMDLPLCGPRKATPALAFTNARTFCLTQLLCPKAAKSSNDWTSPVKTKLQGFQPYGAPE